MTDTDLQDLLRERRQHEPVFLLDPHQTIRAGRRRARVRTAAVGVAAAAGIVAAIGAAGLLGASGPGDRGVASEVPTTTENSEPSQPSQPLPTYLTDLVSSTYGAVATGLGKPQLTVLGPSGAVAADDPAAQSFTATVGSADRLLMLRVIGQPVDGPPPLNTCEVAPQYYTSCTFDLQPEGGYMLRTVGPTSEPNADGTFRVFTDQNLRRVGEEDVFFRRTVVREMADGTMVAADEFVRAATPGEAAAEWRLGVDELRDLAQDPGLAGYDVPHEPWA